MFPSLATLTLSVYFQCSLEPGPRRKPDLSANPPPASSPHFRPTMQSPGPPYQIREFFGSVNFKNLAIEARKKQPCAKSARAKQNDLLNLRVGEKRNEGSRARQWIPFKAPLMDAAHANLGRYTRAAYEGAVVMMSCPSESELDGSRV
ncbi:hypothetical protein CEXT_82111 [Caerostris extrusa]|uniref:Uncharacterized protein n=1 Tax=Caerostris extrusa TaxID=172846 RepID=A0AAV4YCS9_CAEEX|nr:hypothetical protein CEXT_82111 [Caerostris extrusa]